MHKQQPSETRRQSQTRFVRENYKSVMGARVIEEGWFYNDQHVLVLVRPDHFLHRKTAKSSYTLWPTNRIVHVPRSLTRAAKLTVKKSDNTIISNQRKLSYRQ